MASSSSYRKILVPVDGSATSRRGLREAARVAGEAGRLRLIHVVDEMVYARVATASAGAVSGNLFGQLEEAGVKVLREAERLAGKRGAKVETAMLRSGGLRVSDVVLREAKRWGAELIAMGTHGRSGLSRMVMGSDAEAVLRRSTIPLLLAPGGAAPARAVRKRAAPARAVRKRAPVRRA